MAKTIFVRCGDRFTNSDADLVITLPGTLGPADIPEAVKQVRGAVDSETRLDRRGTRRALLRARDGA